MQRRLRLACDVRLCAAREDGDARTTSPNAPTRAALARPARILCEDAELIGYFTDLMYATSALAWASEMFPIAVVMIPDE